MYLSDEDNEGIFTPERATNCTAERKTSSSGKGRRWQRFTPSIIPSGLEDSPSWGMSQCDVDSYGEPLVADTRRRRRELANAYEIFVNTNPQRYTGSRITNSSCYLPEERRQFFRETCDSIELEIARRRAALRQFTTEEEDCYPTASTVPTREMLESSDETSDSEGPLDRENGVKEQVAIITDDREAQCNETELQRQFQNIVLKKLNEQSNAIDLLQTQVNQLIEQGVDTEILLKILESTTITPSELEDRLTEQAAVAQRNQGNGMD